MHYSIQLTNVSHKPNFLSTKTMNFHFLPHIIAITYLHPLVCTICLLVKSHHYVVGLHFAWPDQPSYNIHFKAINGLGIQDLYPSWNNKST